MDQLCTGCGYCMPCPTQVPIPQLMDAYNMKILGASERDIWGRMKWHWGVTAHQAAGCNDCGNCEDKCTQQLPIRDRIALMAQVTGPPNEGMLVRLKAKLIRLMRRYSGRGS